MLLVTAYLLIGEQPSWPGLVGVVIVTLGGYLLAFSSASPNPKKSDARTPSEKVAPVMEQDDSIMGLEMGSKLLIISDPGAKKGLTGVVVRRVFHFILQAKTRMFAEALSHQFRPVCMHAYSIVVTCKHA